MATTRMIRPSSVALAATSSSSSSSSYDSFPSTGSMRSGRVRYMCKAVGFNSENGLVTGENGSERNAVVVAKAAACSAVVTGAVTAATRTSQGVDLEALVAIVRLAVVRRLKVVMRPRPWKFIIQSFIEKVIIDCRFFTMFAVAGTLVGSVLCFLEGAFLVVESYIQYFHALSHHSDHGHTMHLLIESLDMFLVGTAMLIFGMGLHVMFVGSQSLKSNGSQLPSSNFFGLFYLKELPSWVGMKSVTQAKSKIGHALMLLLQVGVLEKFKSIPLVTGLDLACFAGAVFVSAGALFILSRLSDGTTARHY